MPMKRTRVRPRVVSALAKLHLGDKPRELLNRLTPGVERCAWPGCRAHMSFLSPVDGERIQDRYGVLCKTHAADIAIAVIQDQRDSHAVMQFFEQQTTERAVRAEAWRAEEERYEAEKAALRQDREGFVYYLRVGERMKIGYSADVKQRMRAYPPGSQLLAVEPGDRDLERQRHQQFAGSRTDGREWFRPTADILELIEEIVEAHGEPKRFAHHYRRNEQPVKTRRTA
jgi:hypothetical protein